MLFCLLAYATIWIVTALFLVLDSDPPPPLQIVTQATIWPILFAKSVVKAVVQALTTW